MTRPLLHGSCSLQSGLRPDLCLKTRLRRFRSACSAATAPRTLIAIVGPLALPVLLSSPIYSFLIIIFILSTHIYSSYLLISTHPIYSYLLISTHIYSPYLLTSTLLYSYLLIISTPIYSYLIISTHPIYSYILISTHIYSP